MAKITAEEIKLLAKYIYNISGIYLDQNKGYLLETRLSPLLGSHNCSSFMDLYCRAKADTSKVFDKELVNAISTNETLFFRDNKPFELLKNKIIPDLVDRRTAASGQGKTKLRIWSAACSTGQEVYSIAILLLETLGDLTDYDITLLGTDISDEALAKASYGVYGKFEIERGLTKKNLQRYFTPAAGGWRIKDEIRSLAAFRKLNLMDSCAGLGNFDIVFCRNVAIYFTKADKKKLFQKLGQAMQRDGYLIIGGSESLGGIAPQFQAQNYLKGVYYQLRGADELMEKVRKPVTTARSAVKKVRPKTSAMPAKLCPSSVEGKRRSQIPSTSPCSAPSAPQGQKPVSSETSVEFGSIIDMPIETPENQISSSEVPRAGFLDFAGSGKQNDESLLGNLPATKKLTESLVIDRDTANGGEKKVSLLQKISERHQDQDNGQETE